MTMIEIKQRTACAHGEVMQVACVDEAQTVQSSGAFTLTDSSYGKGTVKTLLAGGIATPVEYRRGGNIRKMFDHMHALAANEGAAVALLHPFSFSYYRQFGYERVSDHVFLRFPTAKIDFVPRRCGFKAYKEDMLPDILAVYRTFAKGRNLLLPRVNGGRYADPGRMTYLCYDGEMPIAYVVCSGSKTLSVNHYADTVLTVHEMAYVSPAALREIFSFLRMFEGEYDEIVLCDAGIYTEADMLLTHYMHTAYTIVPDLSARVLNTKAMLSAHEYPQKEGAFTVRVEDTMPSVAGTYRVSYGGGDACVEQLSDGADADVALPVAAFTQLIYGYRALDAHSLAYLEGARILGNCEDLLRAFPRKPGGIFEHF
ncbi:MAG: GNAT family N-acetyltransferase [Clostridia bacterium]|nr:GNAT family N-acetyltransferase [Clostridia bacterium]